MMIWTNCEDIVLITLIRVYKQQVIFSPGQVVAYQKAIKAIWRDFWTIRIKTLLSHFSSDNRRFYLDPSKLLGELIAADMELRENNLCSLVTKTDHY